MRKGTPSSPHFLQSQNVNQRVRTNCTQAKSQSRRPAVAHRQRSKEPGHTLPFNAPETWHEPAGDSKSVRFHIEPPGEGYLHPVTVDEVKDRIAQLPQKFVRNLEVVQFSRMTKK
jgi:hypothetical protein